LWRHVRALSKELNARGVLNYLLSDARYLYAHCGTQLSWLTRRAPFGQARLMDADMTVDFQRETTPDDVVTVVATRPLTDNESWTVMDPGTLTIFGAGERVATFDA
jgi:glutamine amidotransferase